MHDKHHKKLSHKFLLVGFFILVLSSSPEIFSNVVYASTINTSTLTINTQAQNGTVITGLFVALEDPLTSSVISWGYSPASFTVQNGVPYLIIGQTTDHMYAKNQYR